MESRKRSMRGERMSVVEFTTPSVLMSRKGRPLMMNLETIKMGNKRSEQKPRGGVNEQQE